MARKSAAGVAEAIARVLGDAVVIEELTLVAAKYGLSISTHTTPSRRQLEVRAFPPRKNNTMLRRAARRVKGYLALYRWLRKKGLVM